MMRLLFRCMAIALTLAGALLPGNAPAAPAPTVITAGNGPIVIEVGKGILVRLAQRADSVFVADPDVADVQVKSPNLIYVFGKSGGETTLFAVGKGDKVVLDTTIRVGWDIGRIQSAIHDLVPRSSVAVSSVGDALVIDGTVFSADEGDDIRRIVGRYLSDATKQLVNRVKVNAPNQVNLRVRVAEISRDLIKEFGFNWDASFRNGNFLLGLAGGPNVTSVGGIFNTRTLTTDLKTTVDNLVGKATVGNLDVNTLIDALDAEGLITVLAEPNLTAVSGEPASFLAGGEFPVPVASSFTNGQETISISFKKFGVTLSFVATIASGNRINLHVIPEVSELSTTGAVNINNIQIPALATRRADTTVDLASGQSFAIAGLLQNNMTQNIQKFPWLADVPVLGQLFRSESFRRKESELVIIVTPYIVRPTMMANRLQLPTDGFVSSSDNDLLFTGAQYKPQVLKKGTPPISRSGSSLIGPAGFDLD
ncbi:MAG TPA: type II and III secretion system protein family protein [Stellaceae bacterium]